MTTKRWLLALAGTATLSVAGTIVARIALDAKTQRLTRDMNPVADAIVATLQSAALGETREYFVHVPEAYASDTTAHYPILSVLDGEWQSDHTAATAALLARIGVVPRMIVVGVPGVDGRTRHRDYTPPEMRLASDGPSSAMGEADRFLSFLRNELIGRIERDYRTRRPRMLAGVSQGGLFERRAPAPLWLRLDPGTGRASAVRFPARFEPRAVAGQMAYGILRDEDDVERVVAYDLLAPP